MNRIKFGCILALVLGLGVVAGPSAIVAGREAILAAPEVPGGLANSFDDDGYADLAVGVPYEGVDTIGSAGAVNVIYGSGSGGLTPSGDQIWHQDSAGMVDVAEGGDNFGYALGVGDFDGDGFADLAIGVPHQNVGAAYDAGAVHVMYGAYSGLTAVGDEVWHQDSAGIQEMPEDDETFGLALAVGDFDGDGYDDLAIGVPRENVGAIEEAGAVNIIYGSPSGLTATGDQVWHQNSSGIQGTAEEHDFFGCSLAAGDFDHDGRDDLAIGALYEDVDGAENAGAVNVIYGAEGGLTATGDWYFHQNNPIILDTAEQGDHFGYALTSGDFDGDGYADLAIGVPGEDLDGKYGVGAVNVVFGSGSGLGITGNQFWHQDVTGTQNAAEDGDSFGWALAAGDFDRDGCDDLAVGVPWEDLGSTDDTGAVHVFYGAETGLTYVGDWFFNQSVADMLDSAEEDDFFGRALAVGDFDGDSYADLAIGVPGEDLDTLRDAGAVHVLCGSSGGLSATGNEFYHQDSPYIEGLAEVDDSFGYALASVPPKAHKVYLPLVVKEY